jgi:4-amino-4-deoxy-L-arabinose transferase-like glycosyltransferase
MHIVKFLKEYKYLFVVVILGFILRTINIGNVPPALNWDEVSHGYNAYSILKTGKDEWGVSWPIIFRAYGDYKLPIYIYLTTLPELIFGLTPFAVRSVSSFAGVGLIIFSYLLTKKLWGKNVALFTALLVAIEPWTLFLSRGAFEANLGQFFVVSGTYFFIKGLEKSKFIIVSAILFGLSVWTYNSERIFVPIFLIALFIIYKDKLLNSWQNNRKYILLSLFIAAAFFIPMIIQLIHPEGQARYSNVAILDQGAISYIESIQSNSPNLKIIVNRYMYFFYHFIINWLSHFSFSYLFLKGGSNYQFNIPNVGLLYIIDLPLIFLGIWKLLKEKSRSSLFLLSWAILAPIPSSLTREAPHTLRDISFLPIPMILSSLGFFELLKIIKVKKVYEAYALCLICMTFIILCGVYLKNYFYEYPKIYSESWQYGYKEAVNYAKSRYDNYDQIVMTKKYGEPHEFVLFYWPWESENYRNDINLQRYPQSNWFWVDRFDKFYFVNDWDIPKNQNGIWKTERKEVIDISKKTLLITSPGTYPLGWNKLETIKFLDGRSAFDILEN